MEISNIINVLRILQLLCEALDFIRERSSYFASHGNKKYVYTTLSKKIVLVYKF